MADMFVPQSASPMHVKPPLSPHDRGSHDLSTPMPMPSSGLPSGVKSPPPPSSVFCDFDNAHSATRSSSFSKPIDDPMEEITHLRQLLAEKDRHIETIEDAKVKLLKQSMENTAKLRLLESKTSPKAVMESDEFIKKLTTLNAQKESKEMICLKLNHEVKDLCVQNARLKDEVAAKSSILGEYRSLIDKLEEDIEDLKQGGGKENRDREKLLEKMLDEISHLNEDLDASQQQIEELKLEKSIQMEDSSKEIEYLQSLLQSEESQKRTDDEVVVDVLSQMENARLSKFLYSLIKMDGKDVLDIQDLIVLLESGTISMRRRHNTGGPDANREGNDELETGSSSAEKKHLSFSTDPPGDGDATASDGTGTGTGGDGGGGGGGATLDLNVEKSCIVRIMDFLNDDQLVQVGAYLREFFHYSAEFEGEGGGVLEDTSVCVCVCLNVSECV
jgi:hypothetical protein